MFAYYVCKLFHKYHPNPHTSSQKLLPFLAHQPLTGSFQITPHLGTNSEQKPVLIQGNVLTESGHYPIHGTCLMPISQRELLPFHLA